MNIFLVGTGGIGSFLAEHMERLTLLKQINDKFTYFDDDVVEDKNLLYQNFKMSDVGKKKTKALGRRYTHGTFLDERFTENHISNCDLIVLCVDNNAIRKIVYESKKPFIDGRANGRAICLLSSGSNDYLSTMGDDNTPKSCQNAYQLVGGNIEYGNIIIATILAQAILSYSRTRVLPNDVILMFE